MSPKKPNSSRLRAILFDLDGVLIDSSSTHHRGYQQALKGSGIRYTSYRHIAGMKTTDALRTLARRSHTTLHHEALHALARKKSAIAGEMFEKRMPVRAGCRGVLRRLARRFDLALVSSSSLRSVNRFLRMSKTRDFFSVVVTGDDVTRAKPSPAIYKEALRRLRRRPRESVVVEDAITGIQSAARAGMKVWGIPGTFPAATLRKAGAKRIFATLMALERHAQSNGLSHR